MRLEPFWYMVVKAMGKKQSTEISRDRMTQMWEACVPTTLGKGSPKGSCSMACSIITHGVVMTVLSNPTTKATRDHRCGLVSAFARFSIATCSQ